MRSEHRHGGHAKKKGGRNGRDGEKIRNESCYGRLRKRYRETYPGGKDDPASKASTRLWVSCQSFDSSSVSRSTPCLDQASNPYAPLLCPLVCWARLIVLSESRRRPSDHSIGIGSTSGTSIFWKMRESPAGGTAFSCRRILASQFSYCSSRPP